MGLYTTSVGSLPWSSRFWWKLLTWSHWPPPATFYIFPHSFVTFSFSFLMTIPTPSLWLTDVPRGAPRVRHRPHMFLWDALAVQQQAELCAADLVQEQAFLDLVRSISGQRSDFLWFSPISVVSCSTGCRSLGHCNVWTIHSLQTWHIQKYLLEVYTAFVIFSLSGQNSMSLDSQ